MNTTSIYYLHNITLKKSKGNRGIMWLYIWGARFDPVLFAKRLHVNIDYGHVKSTTLLALSYIYTLASLNVNYLEGWIETELKISRYVLP